MLSLSESVVEKDILDDANANRRIGALFCEGYRLETYATRYYWVKATRLC